MSVTIGLKRGIVDLAEHNPDWKTVAAQTIERLWGVFCTVAKDIQHVGSTSIRHIKAKPIIDIAVAVECLDEVEMLMPKLNEAGFYKSKLHAVKDDILVCDDDEFADTRSFHVHIVRAGSIQWSNYINFRDYLNENPSIAKDYEQIKLISAEKHPSDRNAYTNGKEEILVRLLGDAQNWALANEILGRNAFVKIEPLNKGLSGDNKLYIETVEGQRLLLRVAEIDEYDRKKDEYDMLERAANLDIPIPAPIKFGLCNNGNSVYQLLAWVDGGDLEDVLPKLSETEQYVCGLKAGKLLQKINTLPAPQNAEPWADRFWIKVLRRIEFYETHNLKSENGDLIIRFLQENKRIIENRPQTFIHGDFNISNLILTPDGEIGAVDFSCYNKDYGDPWRDIFTFIWGTEVPKYFYTGLINGYFNSEPTNEFFKVLSYYLAYDALAALCDTSIGEQGEPQDGQRHMANVLLWLDNMNNPVPTWYLNI